MLRCNVSRLTKEIKKKRAEENGDRQVGAARRRQKSNVRDSRLSVIASQRESIVLSASSAWSCYERSCRASNEFAD